MGVGVHDDGGRANALQPDRLPHKQHFVVCSWTDDDEVAWAGRVDPRLDSFVGAWHVNGGFAAYGDSNGVDGCLTIGCRDNQLTAASNWRAHLLHSASADAFAGHDDFNRCVAPARDRRDCSIDVDLTGGASEAVMASNELLVVGRRGRCRTRIRMVGHKLVS